ncbi:hypothetical protein ACWCPM_14730 [Streptomyces sp. NPDC002309]
MKKQSSPPRRPHSCHSCRQPVEDVVERHKTMGVYVPVWVAGPCHNPRCDRYVASEAEITPCAARRGGA